MTLRGERLRAAIVPGATDRSARLEVADIADRLQQASEIRADLLVLQHDHLIATPVVHLLRAHAASLRHPRRFLVIDGYDTVRILRHFGHLD